MHVCRNPRILYHSRLSNVICHHQFHVSSYCPKKRQFTKDEISSLTNFRDETDALFGPLLTGKQVKSAISSAGQKSVSKTGDNDGLYSDRQLGVKVARNETKQGETNQISDFPYSVSQQVSSSFVENLTPPVHVVSSHRNISNNTKMLRAEAGQSSVEQKNNCEDRLFGSVERENVCVYKWDDNPPPQSQCNEKNGSFGNTAAASVPHTAKINDHTDQHNQICNHGAGTGISIDTAAEHTAGLPDKNVNAASAENSATTNSLQADEERMSANNTDKQGLSYPLFGRIPLADIVAKVSGRLPGVSAILKATMSPENQMILQRWEQRMIAELGEDGFQNYKKTLFANGSNLHMVIQHYLAGKPEEELGLLPENEGHWESVESVLADITDVICLEKPLRHNQLQYCGVLDCIAEYRGEKYVIDWKTSKRRKSTLGQTFDNPLQLVAYLGAYNVQPTTPLQVERCLLVIGYEDGTAADVHVMDKWDCLRYWSSWLQRLHLFQTNPPS